jgi:hypothetical protein
VPLQPREKYYATTPPRRRAGPVAEPEDDLPDSGHGVVRPGFSRLPRYPRRPGQRRSRAIAVAIPVSTADGYEIPRRIREAMFLQTPASVLPWGTSTSRRMDLDHTIPYRPPARGGPPGQTAMDDLGPPSRAEHRLKTHGSWRLRQPSRGCTCGAHPSTQPTLSPTPAPKTSARTTSPTPSGGRQALIP